MSLQRGIIGESLRGAGDKHVRRPTALSLLALAITALAASCQRTDESAGPAAAPPQTVKTAGGIEMVRLPAGVFTLGDDRGKPDETPAHKVWIDAILMDAHEVTQEDYGKLILGNPSHFKGPDRPMEQISWAKAAVYCNARSKAEGLAPCYDEDTAECHFAAGGYRLPTEAEWEYACRAGGAGAYAFGNDASRLRDFAWFTDNGAKATHPVAKKKPNAWGLFDMHGNVAEWCNDVYAEDYYQASPDRNPRGPATGKRYVLRGGAWNSSAQACRAAYRVAENPGFQDACFALDAIGFRCVRKAPPGGE